MTAREVVFFPCRVRHRVEITENTNVVILNIESCLGLCKKKGEGAISGIRRTPPCSSDQMTGLSGIRLGLSAPVCLVLRAHNGASRIFLQITQFAEVWALVTQFGTHQAELIPQL